MPRILSLLLYVGAVGVTSADQECQGHECPVAVNALLQSHAVEAPLLVQAEASAQMEESSHLGEATQACINTPDWSNGHNSDCAFYASHWCENGGAKSGYAWMLGATYNYPELNCCDCGRQASSCDATVVTRRRRKGTCECRRRSGASSTRLYTCEDGASTLTMHQAAPCYFASANIDGAWCKDGFLFKYGQSSSVFKYGKYGSGAPWPIQYWNHSLSACQDLCKESLECKAVSYWPISGQENCALYSQPCEAGSGGGHESYNKICPPTPAPTAVPTMAPTDAPTASPPRTESECKAGHSQTGGYQPYWDQGCMFALDSSSCTECQTKCSDKYTWNGALAPCNKMCSYGFWSVKPANDCPATPTQADQ